MQVKKLLTNSFKPTVILATLSLVGYVAFDDYRQSLKAIEDYKQEIFLKDSVRYQNFSNEYKSKSFYEDAEAWRNERDEMLDSLEKIGIAQKAYYEGAQMVRDSIANANKK